MTCLDSQSISTVSTLILEHLDSIISHFYQRLTPELSFHSVIKSSHLILEKIPGLLKCNFCFDWFDLREISRHSITSSIHNNIWFQFLVVNYNHTVCEFKGGAQVGTVCSPKYQDNVFIEQL